MGKLLRACGVLLFLEVILALPQFKNTYLPPKRTNTREDEFKRGVTVKCLSRRVSDSKVHFTCEGADPSKITLKSEHILWLKSPTLKTEDLEILVPNYKLDEIIIGALKKNSEKLESNIDIQLLKPATNVKVIKQEGESSLEIAQNVKLGYEEIGDGTKIHYPTDKKYDESRDYVDEPVDKLES